MNMPVIGSLFRSRDFQRNETELLIIVTPYIVHAVDPIEVVRPDRISVEASDPQAWLLGRVNRIYSTAGNLRPMPNYSAKSASSPIEDWTRPMTTNTARKAARMDIAQELAAAAPKRLAALMLAAAASAALSGCGVNYASSDPVIRRRLSRSPSDRAGPGAHAASRSFRSPAGSTRSRSPILRAFAERYKRLGGGQIAILTPSSQGSTPRPSTTFARPFPTRASAERLQSARMRWPTADPRRADPRRLSVASRRTRPYALRSMAGRSGVGRFVAGLEKRRLLELRLRHPGGARRPGRRSPRSRRARSVDLPDVCTCA